VSRAIGDHFDEQSSLSVSSLRCIYGKKKEKCLLKSMSDTSVVLLAQTEFITIRHDTNSNNLPRGANRSSNVSRERGQR